MSIDNGNVSFQEAIRIVVSSIITGINTCLPGRVEKYEYETRRAEVLPLVSKKYIDGQRVDYQPISDIPVMFPASGTTGIHYPVKKGDTVLLIFAQRALDNWLLSGDITAPGDNRKYDITDAIAIPGLYSFNVPNFADNNDDIVINGDNKITIKNNGDIEIGGAGLKKLINEEFKNTYNNHVHNFTAAPTGTFSTSKPASVTTTAFPSPGVGGVVAAFGSQIDDSQITTKTSAE
jgi:hypothetical protein